MNISYLMKHPSKKTCDDIQSAMDPWRELMGDLQATYESFDDNAPMEMLMGPYAFVRFVFVRMQSIHPLHPNRNELIGDCLQEFYSLRAKQTFTLPSNQPVRI